MAEKNQAKEACVSGHSDVALLLIDVINDLEFPGGDVLLPQALEAGRRIAALKRRCAQAGIPAIYVNDNFGRWQSDFRKLVEHCCHDGVRGCELAKLLAPDEKHDYFVLKPRHSGFFSTTLDVLLDHIRARTLILTGFAGDICVLFTANDAYMREFSLVVPEDCVASLDPRGNHYALEQMRTVLKADTRPSTQLDLEGLSHAARKAGKDGGGRPADRAQPPNPVAKPPAQPATR